MNRALCFAVVLCASSCNGGPGSAGDGTGDSQTPPTVSAAAMDAWVAQGFYQSWHCEPAAHAVRDPSPHKDQVRTCSNDVLSAAGTGPYPVGAANVKEIFSNGKVAGHAVYVKDKVGGGEAFLWYERMGDNLFAFGHGDSGTPLSSCVGCHVDAGPSLFGHDFVYTQVK